VEQVISEGINVNVTLLFSVNSYVETFWAYIRGLEKRVEKGEDISKIASVASFFLSRIDSNIDEKIDAKLKQGASEPGSRERLLTIKGKVAIANAKIAYQEYKKIIQSDRWKALSAKRANVQRLLWASTGTKNPDYSDVMYVDELIGSDTVNTLPPATIEACADHCNVADRIETNVEEAYNLLESLKDPDININLDEVMDELLTDGIDKFVKPFQSLMQVARRQSESTGNCIVVGFWLLVVRVSVQQLTTNNLSLSQLLNSNLPALIYGYSARKPSSHWSPARSHSRTADSDYLWRVW
jgi:transaldolase